MLNRKGSTLVYSIVFVTIISIFSLMVISLVVHSEKAQNQEVIKELTKLELGNMAYEFLNDCIDENDQYILTGKYNVDEETNQIHVIDRPYKITYERNQNIFKLVLQKNNLDIEVILVGNYTIVDNQITRYQIVSVQ